MPNTIDAARWTMLAEKARALAETMRNEAARQTMLDIAAGYDRLARQAGQLADRPKVALDGSE
jgi:hypothetical protein